MIGIVSSGLMWMTQNKRAILTGISVATTVLAAAECGRASVKAYNKILEMHYESEEEPTTKEKVMAVSTLYIKTLSLLGVAVGCQFASLSNSEATIAALSAIASKHEKDIERGEEAIKEICGENKLKKVQEEVGRKDIQENPPREDAFYDTGTGKTKFRDGTMGGDFIADIESVKHAFNTIDNRLVSGMVDYNELLSALNREQVQAGINFVWNQGEDLNVRMQQENYVIDLFDATSDEVEQDTIWVIYYTEPHSVSDSSLF